MNYAFAIKQFEALNGEIDEVKRDDLTLLVQDSASSLIQKFDILLKNFYPIVDDFGNTQFTPILNGIAINNYLLIRLYLIRLSSIACKVS